MIFLYVLAMKVDLNENCNAAFLHLFFIQTQSIVFYICLCYQYSFIELTPISGYHLFYPNVLCVWLGNAELMTYLKYSKLKLLTICQNDLEFDIV